MKKIALLILLVSTFKIYAQERVITTAVPFLLIAADARSAGMADMGVATSPDAFSQQFNPAKFAFSSDGQGFSLSYTPYLVDIASDIFLGQLTYYNRINEKSAFAGSLRYFGLGDIVLRTDFDDPGRTVTPNELAVDLSYSLKLSERFAMAVAGRFISSNLRIPDATTDGSAASTFAFDVAGYYQSEEIAFSDFYGRWRGGFNFQNLGPKINYDNDVTNTNFIPSNMRLGGGFDFIFDDYNKVSVSSEFTKLLVPTPQNPDLNGDGVVTSDERTQNIRNYKNIGWVSGVFDSFNDAPNGISEELKEFTWALGAEYTYQDSFSIRGGYFNESVEKGARKFISLGAGFKYQIVKIDLSYLFAASKIRNPLENTLRFSLTFNFGDEYDEY
jgi:hypothetical protein